MNGLKFILGLSLAAITSSTLVSCEEPEAPEPILRPVRVQKVTSAGVERQRSFSGFAKAGLESKVSFKVGGTIRRIPIKVGDRLKRGALVAELDPQDYEVRVQQSDASLARAKAQARNAKANYERTRELYENNNASRSELDQARAGAEAAVAAVRSAAKELEFAGLQLRYTRVAALADCSVAEKKVYRNENVGAGQVIATLTCGLQTEVEVGMPEAYIARIKQGSVVNVEFDAIPGNSYRATVTEVGVAAMGQATYPVTVRLNKPDRRVLPGMAAEVSFQFAGDGSGPLVIVPPAAVAEDRQGRFVFIAEPAEPGLAVARRRPVKVGQLTAAGFEILEGLSDGELLITAGVSRIEDGLKVKLPGG